VLAQRGGPVRTVQHTALPDPMLLVDFPGGGHLSMEVIAHARDEVARSLRRKAGEGTVRV
jgi:hypothetical protein